MLKNITNYIIFTFIFCFITNAYIKTTEDKAVKDICLFNYNIEKVQNGLNINSICQYRVAQQSSDPEGGGGLSCGYHALKNSLAIVNALTQNWTVYELSFYLKSKEIVKNLFGNKNSEWRNAVTNNSQDPKAQDTYLHADEIKRIIAICLLEQPNVEMEDLNLGHNIKVVFTGDMYIDSNNILREYENGEIINPNLYNLIQDLKNNNFIKSVLIINDNGHWYSCVLDNTVDSGLYIYLADSFNCSKLKNSKFLQILKILDPANKNMLSADIIKLIDSLKFPSEELGSIVSSTNSDSIVVSKVDENNINISLQKGLIGTIGIILGLYLGSKVVGSLLSDDTDSDSE